MTTTPAGAIRQLLDAAPARARPPLAERLTVRSAKVRTRLASRNGLISALIAAFVASHVAVATVLVAGGDGLGPNWPATARIAVLVDLHPPTATAKRASEAAGEDLDHSELCNRHAHR
jgi:hypothetical protein